MITSRPPDGPVLCAGLFSSHVSACPGLELPPMNLILLEASEIDSEGRARLAGRVPKHLNEVLGAAVGDRLRVGVLGGALGSGRVQQLDAESVELLIELDAAPPAPPPVDLLVALPRPQTLKKLLLEATSMGLRRFIFVGSERNQKSYFHTKVLKNEEWRRHLRLGLEQACDTQEPELLVEPRLWHVLKHQLDELAPGARRIVLHPGPEAKSLAKLELGSSPVVLAIGPEGGWLGHEVEALIRHGFESVSLGPRILRVETATVAALAQLALIRGLG